MRNGCEHLLRSLYSAAGVQPIVPGAALADFVQNVLTATARHLGTDIELSLASSTQPVVLHATALAIRVIPILLIAVSTVSMCIGAKRMAEHNVVVYCCLYVYLPQLTPRAPPVN
ncbi:hypothetical protein FRC12_001520 [Ceratobasidium sp. 428]|nr:hypothetical protein FRC12_001520 [Ceratobasidium sp. 428]